MHRVSMWFSNSKLFLSMGIEFERIVLALLQFGKMVSYYYVMSLHGQA